MHGQKESTPGAWRRFEPGRLKQYLFTKQRLETPDCAAHGGADSGGDRMVDTMMVSSAGEGGLPSGVSLVDRINNLLINVFGGFHRRRGGVITVLGQKTGSGRVRRRSADDDYGVHLPCDLGGEGFLFRHGLEAFVRRDCG